MKLWVNGVDQAVEETLSVGAFLAQLGLEEKPVVVELNETALLPREYVQTLLKDGDRLEIVQITAGG